MEVCPEAELIAIENATALGDDVLEISKGLEVLVGERLIQNGPEVLGGLKLGGGWGAGRPAGSPPGQPGSAQCAIRRCRARGRRCDPVPPQPHGQTAPAARQRM